MTKKKIVLTFPPAATGQPIAYNLVRNYDIKINIIRGKISPEEEGTLVVELEAEDEVLQKGLDYIKGLGIDIMPFDKKIQWNEERCTHCTACIPLCPTGAFRLDRASMLISFDSAKCVACELCLKACPFQAINISI